MNHRLNILRGLVLPGLAALVAATSCNSDSTGSNQGGTGGSTGEYKSFCDLPVPCQQIAQTCHSKDDGSKGPVHDCHTLAHEGGMLEVCSAHLTDCLQTCKSAPALYDGPAEDLGAACRDASSKAP